MYPSVGARGLGVWLGVGLSLALALPGCGDDSGGVGSCGKVEPCGGDVVGDWTITGLCLNRATLMTDFGTSVSAFCPSATITAVDAQASGSLSFSPDSTYRATTSLNATVKVSIPSSCLQGVTCAVANLGLQVGLSENPQATIKSLICAGTTACVCTVVLQPQLTDETGAYSTSSTMLTLMPPGRSDTGDYCVQGKKELHLVVVDRTMSMGPLGQATINEDLLATKN